MDISLLYMSVFVFVPFITGACLAVYSFSTVEAAQQPSLYKKIRNAAIGLGLMSMATVMCIQFVWAVLLAIGGVVSAAMSYRMWRTNRTMR